MKNSDIIFAIGLFITTLGFFSSHATDIHFASRLIAPSYTRAKQGLDALKTKNTLAEQDSGYKDVSRLLVEHALEYTSNAAPSESDLPPLNANEFQARNITNSGVTGAANALSKGVRTGLTFYASAMGYTVSPNIPHVPPNYYFSWGLDELTAKVDHMKDLNLLRFSLTVFVLGIIVSIVGFIDKRIETKKSNPPALSTESTPQVSAK
jgi:hypothetical protein